jgi:hypothetical protein
VKRARVWAVLLLLLGAFALLQQRKPPLVDAPTASTAVKISPPSPPARAASYPAEASSLNQASSSAQADVEALHALIIHYLTALQRRSGPPLGDDIDLASILKGNNPLRVALLPVDHPAFSPDGHLRDRFGTPYHLHALSGRSYEVRSAGPDKKLFTQDDALHPPRAAVTE